MTRTGIAALALLLTSCAEKSLALPTDPIDRAATCAVVTAVEARAATPDVNAVLPFEAQGRILHFALLGGSESGSFSNERAVAVNERMAAVQDKVIDGKWQDLVPACREAFPAASKAQASLPDNARAAQLGCDELGEFINKAMARQSVEYGNELGEYVEFNRIIDSKIGGTSRKQTEERRKALATIVQAGQPVAVMRQCIERFG